MSASGIFDETINSKLDQATRLRNTKAYEMARMPSYSRAIGWIVRNDDCEWLKYDNPTIRGPAALVAYMFGKTAEEVIAALRKKPARRRKRQRRKLEKTNQSI